MFVPPHGIADIKARLRRKSGHEHQALFTDSVAVFFCDS
jgi:hypothetical protein